MAVIDTYGYGPYGSGLYGGFLIQPSQYIHTTIEFVPPTEAQEYLHTTTLLETAREKYFQSTINFLVERDKYLHTTTDLVYTKYQYLHSLTLLNKELGNYLHTTITPVFGLLTQEVDDFQVIIDGYTVKFYWRDTLSLADKSYLLYESSDSGKTWNLLTATTDSEYELTTIPYQIESKLYRLSVSSGTLISYGVVSYPAFSVKNLLEELDNGYWDIGAESNLYKMFLGIGKEAHSRAELESKLTADDRGITQIRRSRMSAVYGTAFAQETDNATEDYRRKIWNLFLGFRNSVTFAGAYYVTKAFTNIPPRITRLYKEGWVVGKSVVGVDTTPLSSITALYGLSFEIHLPKKTSGTVDSVSVSATTFTATADDFFIDSTDFYKDHYLVFKTGDNTYISRKILGFNPTSTIVGQFVTEAFPSDIQATDTFFVSAVSTVVVEEYIKDNVSAHSLIIFRYFSEFITENFQTGFTGVLSNLELVPSRRIRLINTDVTIDDNGKIVQAVYDSGTGLTRASSLVEFGGRGIACWDNIAWGDVDIDFRLYLTFSDDLVSGWLYAEEKTKFVLFTGVQEETLEEYIKENTEVVKDLEGNTFIKDVDYTIDYRNGTIRRTINSNISTAVSIVVTYDLEWGQVTQNQEIALNKSYFKYRFTVDGIDKTDDFEFAGFYIKSLGVG